jgi:8-oxo-dGTP pyrophosphatase MutT (NUDIX family)
LSSSHRRAVRVILRTPENKVLLFLSHFEPGSGLEPAWVFPGGGIEPAETESEAAIRELAEETGRKFELKALGEAFATLEHEMPDTRIYKTGEAHFYELVIQDQFEPDSSGWTLDEHRDTVAHRWWSRQEILEEQPWIEPVGSLAVLLERLAEDPGTPRQS